MRERGERDRRSEDGGRKKMSLLCGGLAGEQAELKVFEVYTKLLAKWYLSFSLKHAVSVCLCVCMCVQV